MGLHSSSGSTFIGLIAIRAKTKGMAPKCHFKLTVILGGRDQSNALTLDWACEQVQG